MKKLFSISLVLLSFSSQAQKFLQDSTLQISGSADIYYKYDFEGQHNNQTLENVVLGTKQNSIDFGMFDLRIKKQMGKASIFSELAFGSRPYFNLTDPQLAYNIQNLYASYQFTPKLSVSAGLMFRYQTYEKMVAADNFHYAMSYSFLNQYFNRSAGVRATYVINDKAKIVAGIYNSYDPKGASNPVVADPKYGVSDFCGQFFITPFKNMDLSVALWKEGQKDNGVHRNFQANYKATKSLKFGLDITKYTCRDTVTANHSYQSAVLYSQFDVTKKFHVGARYEYMERTETPNLVNDSWTKEYYSNFTFTTSFTDGPLTFKQEIKFDNTPKNNTKTFFLDKNDLPTNKAAQIVFAAIYKF